LQLIDNRSHHLLYIRPGGTANSRAGFVQPYLSPFANDLLSDGEERIRRHGDSFRPRYLSWIVSTITRSASLIVAAFTGSTFCSSGTGSKKSRIMALTLHQSDELVFTLVLAREESLTRYRSSRQGLAKSFVSACRGL